MLFTVSFILLCYALLILYYLKGWKSLPVQEAKNEEPQTFLSVIIPARNEAGNIAAILDCLSRQSYPVSLFEVIVVDDHSTDDTVSIAQRSSLNNLVLIQSTAAASQSSKKKSIQSGIEAARGELIITTDADCTMGPEWLSCMEHLYKRKNAQFIAAPVRFISNSSMLQQLQSIDFLTLQGITAASVATGFHNMCNGANLAYTRKAFYEVNGFEGIDHVATGDDMLLMHKIAVRYPGQVFFLKNNDAVVSTKPMPDWKSFLMQRRRWASKSLVYKDWRIIAVLFLVLLVNGILPLLLLYCFFQPVYWWTALAFIIIKTAIEWPFVSTVSRFFKQKVSFLSFLFLQPVHIFYTILVGIWSQFGNYEWKERRYAPR